MPIRIVLTLVSSPAYGLLVTLLVLPVVIVANGVVVAIAILTPFLPMLAAICAFVAQLAVYVQTARYAVALCKLTPLRKQPGFVRVAGMNAVPALGFAALSAVAVVVYAHQADIDLFPSAAEPVAAESTEQPTARTRTLAPARGPAPARTVAPAAPPAPPPPPVAEEFEIDFLDPNRPFVILMRGGWALFLSVFAMYIVPRTARYRTAFDQNYAVGFLIARFCVAMPFFAVFSAVLGHLAFRAVASVTGTSDALAFVPALTQYALESAIFAGMIFSFEALLQRVGRTWSQLVATLVDGDDSVDSGEYRELRKSWGKPEAPEE